jgi:antitoxin (DNA-binding transcriptional repressor) of toxin-antitoxin stability system
MTRTLSVNEMPRVFADYIRGVASGRENIILTLDDKPVAEIRPLPKGLPVSELAEVLKPGRFLTPEEAEDFARDIEEAREELNRLPARDPWED